LTEPAMTEPAMTELAMTELAMTELAMTELAMTEPAMTEERSGSEPDAKDEASFLVEFMKEGANRSMKAILARNPLPFLQAHRRQTAAAVILFCVAVIWAEEGTSIAPAPSAQTTADMTSVESLLSDFETVDSGAQREPAEPVNPLANGFQLAVPQSPADLSAGSEASPASQSSAALAVYPDEESGSGFSAGSPFYIPNSTQPTTVDSIQESGSRNGVRFTGRIQPLK